MPPALRQRVVAAYGSGEGTDKELAERFDVGPASVRRWLRCVHEDRLEPGRKGPVPHARQLKEQHLAFLSSAIEAVPDSTAPGFVVALREEFELNVSEATVKRARRRLGFTPRRNNRLRSKKVETT